MKKLLAAVVMVATLVAGTAGLAGAQSDAGGPDSTTTERVHHPRRAALRIAAGAAATTIGITVAELREAVRSGQSVASVAEAKGIEVGDVEQAIVSALTEAVDKASANGRLTDERATRIKERLPEIADRLVHFERGQHHDQQTQTTSV